MFISYCLLISLAVCKATAVTLTKSVEIIGESNFTDYIKPDEKIPSIVMFYAPWCSHSKDFLPVYDSVAKRAGIPLYKVDCVAEKNLYWQEGIISFPTIKVYMGAYNLTYSGERDYDSFMKFARRMKNPSIYKLSSVNGGSDTVQYVDHIAGTAKPALFVYNPTKSSDFIEQVDFVCKKVAPRVTCYETANDEVARKLRFATSSSGMAMLRKFTGEPDIVDGVDGVLHGGVDTIHSFIVDYSYPLLTDFIEQNKDYLFSPDRPGFQNHIMLVLDPTDAAANTALTAFRDVAQMHRSKAVFIHLNPNHQSPMVETAIEDLKLDTSAGATALIIQSSKTKINFYSLPPLTDINRESIAHWVAQFFSGDLKAARVEVFES